MGAVYKRKRSSCAMCKPHKRGIVPKKTAKETNLAKIAKEEIKEVLANK